MEKKTKKVLKLSSETLRDLNTQGAGIVDGEGTQASGRTCCP